MKKKKKKKNNSKNFMELSYQHLLPEDFNADSKVWIYQSSRIFLISEALELETMMEDFITNWKSHGTPVRGYANLFFGRFIIIIADETATKVSGCSTDSSVHFIQSVEQKFKMNLFDRQTLAFVIKDKIEFLPLAQLNYAVENNFINSDTIYFNNLVTTKSDLLNKWIAPIKATWLAAKINKLSTT
jgi:hypothetical protein